MGRLAKSLVYLSGSMDFSPDNGREWRENIIPLLRDNGIGVLNPCNKPTLIGNESEEERKKYKENLNNNNFNEVKKFAKPIVGVDLRLVHKADFLILYIDIETFMFGSVVEYTWAVQQRKPVLIVIKQGKQKSPLFTFGMIPHEHIFNNFDEMFDYLKDVDDETKPLNDMRRWYFFDYNYIFGDKQCL